MCERLRIDSRRYPGTIVSDGKSMPVALEQGQMFNVYLKPLEGDWRLDAYEARNINMTLDLIVTAISSATSPAQRDTVMESLRACVLINEWFFDFRPAEWAISTNWAARCLNLQGRTLDRFGRNATFKYVENPASKGSTFVLRDKIVQLPRRADGWRVLIWNNGSVPVDVSVVMQLKMRPINCSDKRDGPAIAWENTHSLAFEGNRNVASLGPKDVCEAKKLAYCDNSFTSGRQLDRCFVCGGDCFLPDCVVGSCVSESSYLSSVRYLGEFSSNNLQGLVRREFHTDTYSDGSPCPSPTSPDIPCQGIDCNVRGGCKGRAETYKVNTLFMDILAGETRTFTSASFVYDPPWDPRMITVGFAALVIPPLAQDIAYRSVILRKSVYAR
jgi:hypothetical protein